MVMIGVLIGVIVASIINLFLSLLSQNHHNFVVDQNDVMMYRWTYVTCGAVGGVIGGLSQ
jgi:hypothetical protein